MSQSDPVSRHVLDQAIDWQLRFGEIHDNPEDLSAWKAWLNAHPEHLRAWEQLNGIERYLTAAKPPMARQTLLKRPSTLQRGRTLLSLAVVVLLGLAVTDRYVPLRYALADAVTPTGEQRVLTLPDDTRLTLAGRSALDIRFDAQQRRIVLRTGEILIETGHGDTRPFIVETPAGHLRALGTRFIVAEEPRGTRLTVLRSAVAAHPRHGLAEAVIPEGDAVLMTPDQLDEFTHAAPGAAAWAQGMLVVDNERLDQVIAALGRERVGLLTLDPQLADLRVTGSFPLHDTERALRALSANIPIRIERHTPFWLAVKPDF
ncbi:FecR family protein [Pseudomonas duriflava]|uniref:FecR family protein n=1 Tax=Pseudomonas duriflava TaxID=459528 RepID=A0A562QKG9_9PSED|nr:FecR domain-containing protein [Pseudomonas duriflava]TWI56690.1 FecR family protein [Pseudomonas duriflava]